MQFDSAVVRAFVTNYDFYPKTGWMPAVGSVRAALRLLAEQTDGVDLSCAYQTASFRYDKASALDDWAVVGTVATTEGDADTQDLVLNVAGKFWMRLGYAIRKAAGAGGIGVANAGVLYSLPTERPELLVGPVLLNVFDNPVGSSYTEVLTTEWMPFYQLVAVMVAYESFNATNLRYQVVLQSVKTDPSLETPAEDAVLGAVVGNTSGVATANNFPNATANKAMLCRVVVKADNHGAGSSQGTGRIYFAAATQYQ